MATEFKFEVEGINLPADAVKRIEKGIQSLVLQELAGNMPGSENITNANDGFEFYIPKGWHGGRIISMLKAK